MTLQTFPAAPLPDLPLSQSPNFATERTQFGDGYAIETTIGINAKQDEVSISWTNITASEYDIVIGFIEAHAPVTPFYFTPQDGTQRTYTCKDYSNSQVSAGFYEVRATFKQYHGV